MLMCSVQVGRGGFVHLVRQRASHKHTYRARDASPRDPATLSGPALASAACMRFTEKHSCAEPPVGASVVVRCALCCHALVE